MNADVLEVLMIVSFGIAWIFSVAKALKTKSVKGKSILFEILMLCAYGFGVVEKVFLYKEAMAQEKSLNFWFYLAWFLGAFIFIVVVIDLLLWIRNSFLDLKRDKEEKKKVDELQTALSQATEEAKRAKEELAKAEQEKLEATQTVVQTEAADAVSAAEDVVLTSEGNEEAY